MTRSQALHDARGPALFAAVGGLVGAALIHADQITDHLAEWWAAGWFFIALTVLQTVLAGWLLLRRSEIALKIAVWSSGFAIALWALSRSIGIPFGPERWLPERLGRPDLASNGLEVVSIIGALWLLRNRDRRVSRAVNAVGIVLLSTLFAAVLTLGLAPQGECADHGDWPFGPLVPVDGHAMVYETTPATAVAGQDKVAIVVGYLKNCGARDVALQAVELTSTGGGATVGSLRVVPADRVTSTNDVSLEDFWTTGTPARGARIPPTGDQPKLVLTALLDVAKMSNRYGDFFIDAVFVRYRIGWRSFRAPFGSAARLQLTGRHS